MFIASPGDLAEERRAFQEAIDEFNTGFAAGADAQLEGLAWEETLSTVGRRPQSVINELVDICDCFVLVLHRRWGQKTRESRAALRLGGFSNTFSGHVKRLGDEGTHTYRRDATLILHSWPFDENRAVPRDVWGPRTSASALQMQEFRELANGGGPVIGEELLPGEQ